MNQLRGQCIRAMDRAAAELGQVTGVWSASWSHATRTTEAMQGATDG